MTEDFELIIVCAERYALGRQTYMPSVVIKYIRSVMSELSDKTLYNLSNDLHGATNFGDESIDKPEWLALRDEIDAMLKERDFKYAR